MFDYSETELCVKDMEIARLREFLTDWANDVYMAGDDGYWYTDEPSEKKRVDKLNKLLIG